MEPADSSKAVTNVADHERHVRSEDVVICKLLLVNPATSSTDERTFAMQKRAKTRLQVNMNQQKFNHVTISRHTQIRFGLSMRQ